MLAIDRVTRLVSWLGFLACAGFVVTLALLS